MQIVLATLFSLISALVSANNYYIELTERIHAIKASDGIDSDEASTISEAAYELEQIGCGAPLSPELIDNQWVIKTLHGFAAEEGEPIFVNEKTGTIKWRNITMPLNELKNNFTNEQ